MAAYNVNVDMGPYDNVEDNKLFAEIMDALSWYSKFLDGLRNEPGGEVWVDGDMIMCKSKEVAIAIADMMRCQASYHSYNPYIRYGYYDPDEVEIWGYGLDEEDIKELIGWWFVDVD